MVSGRSTAVQHAMFVLLLTGTILCGELFATITTLGSIDPPYGAADPWVFDADEFIVGFEGDGTLSITAGSDVTVNAPAFVGDYASEFGDTTGTLQLTGSGSTLTIGGENEFYVGPFASGYLSVADMAILTTYDVIIGGSPAEGESEEVTTVVPGEGHASVSGGAQWNTGDWGWLTIGAAGFGELSITGAGSSVTGDTGEIGLVPDAVGQVLVEQGGLWSLSQDLMVGIWGNGSLMVSGGGQVQSTRGWVGGVDTRVVTYDEPIFDGYGDPAGTGQVVVTGADSVWDSGDRLVVGATGTGTLGIEDGGTVTASGVYIGGMPIVLGPEEEYSRDLLPDGVGTVTVTGEGSLLEVPEGTGDEVLFVGYTGTGTLNVEAGGDVTAPSVVLGGTPDATGTILVTGSGSTLSVAHEINVGAWGTGELTVSDGGSVSAEELLIGGFDANDVDDLPQEVLDDFGPALGSGTVTVTGASSTLEAAERIYVGTYGEGTLNVNLGGNVTAGEIAVGVAPGSQGTVNITGAGSLVHADETAGVEEEGYVPGVMIVGGYGTGAVTVSEGGQLAVDEVLYIGGYPAEELDFQGPEGQDPDGTGTVTVTGAESSLEATGMAVGVEGNGTLEILNGADVLTEAAVVGMGENGVGEVLVDGAGSLWDITSEQLENEVPDALGEGNVAISNGGHVNVSGTGLLNVADLISVGSQGDGSMWISDGGSVTADTVDIGGTDPQFDTIQEYFDPEVEFTEGEGAVTVDGAGSSLNTESLVVGFAGSGSLSISAGGSVTSQTAVVGVIPDATGTVELMNGSTWDAGENLVVGMWGQGDLTISSASQVTANEMYIGGAAFDVIGAEYDADLVPDGTGTVTVTGAGSLLDVIGEETLYVGYSGTGTLNVEAGGDVTAGTVVIGAAPDVVGTTVVTGAGSTLTAEDFQIGAWGTGSLTVSNSGAVSTDYMAIGGMDASEVNEVPAEALEDFGDPVGPGTVTVTGAGSSLEAQMLLAGVTGQGTVQVAAGGSVESELAVVGLGEGSTGTVTVTGTDSVLRMQAVGEEDPDYGVLAVGGWGTGQLTVSNGGLVDASRVYIGGLPAEELTLRGEDADWGEGDPAGTGTVTVTGEGSRLNVSGDFPLLVGYAGTGTLTASEGGEVSSNGLMIGGDPNATGTVTIDNGELSVSGDAVVGGWGQGNLTVSNGGQASVGTLIIGGFDETEAPGSEELGNALGTGTVAVTGAGSVLDVSEDNTIYVGYSGDGTLEILNGGQVNSHSGIVGVEEGSTGLVTVDGTNSSWMITGGETAPVLTALGDGEVVVRNGGEILLSGTNGVLDVGGTVTVGSEGSASVMEISDGAQVYSEGGVVGGYDPQFDDVADYFDPEIEFGDGTGSVTVSGAGSSWEMEALEVGFSGAGTLVIENGGSVFDQLGMVGVVPDGAGTVEVTGAGSRWESLSDLVVGAWGTGDLTISAGGRVLATDAYVGGMPFDVIEAEEDPDYAATGTGNVTVTGAGSELFVTAPASLYVGYSGEGTLDVNDGGYVESNSAVIGAMADSVGQVTVDGVSEGEESVESTWENSGSMVVGGYGTGSLTISNGGEVSVGDTLYIGGFDIGQGFPTVAEVTPDGTGEVTVTGEGSLLDVMFDLSIGDTSVGTLTVADGGRVVTSQDGRISGQEGATGTAVVTGSSSQWVISDDLYVAYDGTGTLTVSDGGSVVADEDTFIGFDESSTGTAVVTGEDSVLSVGSSLYVGGHNEGSAGIGSLFANDGGEVRVFNELFIWETGLVGGDGTIAVASLDTVHNYGTIAPGDDGVGTLTVEGSVVFYEGSTFAVDVNNSGGDKLVVDGDVTIEGGTVQVGSEGTVMGEHDYEIISADSVTGEFVDLDTALLDFSFSEIGLDYNDASVWLHVAAANFNDPNIARTDNQRAVAGALQEIGGEGGNDVTDAVQDLETADDVRDSYDQLSGQTRPALAPMTVAGTSKFLGTVTSRVQTVKNGLVAGAFDPSRLMAAAGPDQAVGGSPASNPVGGQTFAVGNGSSVLADKRWGLWGRGYGLFGDRDSENSVPGYGYNIYGGSFGVDYQFTESLLAGLVGGMSEGDVDFDSSRDSTDFGAAHIGLYGSLAWDAWNVDSVFTYASLDYETRRFVDLLDERLSGNFDGSELAAYVEVSRDYDLAQSLSLSPLASLQYTYVNLDSYTETGGASALAFDEQTHESVRGSLGARLTKRLIETAGDFQADAQVRGRWVHEFGDAQASVDSSFTSDPTVIFTVKDEEISRDSAILGAGLCAEMNRQTRVYVDYDTRLNSDESIHVISASLQYRW